MRFDEWWGDDDTPVGDYPKLPDGRHSGEIVVAEFRDLKFKVSDRNPIGKSLVVKVQVPKYERVETIVPVQYRGLIEAICRAARVATPVKGEDWDETTLIGQQVQIETVLGIGKTGREFVRVDQWHPAPEPLPEAVKKAPARTPAAKVEAAGQGGSADDIPF